MTGSRVSGALAVALLAAGAVLAVAPAPAAAKEPAACQQVSFRTIPPGAPDGVQDAGMKPTRSGRIEIKADVAGGAAKHYFMVLKGNKIDGVGKAKVSDACLKQSNVALPYKTQPAGQCTGDRFRVVLEKGGGGKFAAQFFGLQGGAWALCSSGEF
jgi:hypothetical protein